MNVLGLDFGSSSVKAGILRGTSVVGEVVSRPFKTRYDGVRAEVHTREILGAMAAAIRDLGKPARNVETIALSVMSPAWVAMDHEGRAITPIVTHQDRRSVELARELERRLGKARYLKLAGNRPFPGGISCTTWAWFLLHAAPVMKKADLCGHLNTFLHRQLTHARLIDPSNASFTGFYETLTQKGWNDDLIDTVGIQRHRLPQIIGSDAIGGFVTRSAAARFGLTHGTPVLAGMVDTSAAMLLAGGTRGLRAGQLVNVSGSTDVLGLLVQKPIPHERLLTRALGVGKNWMSVGTVAAAGSALDWARRELFGDWPQTKFWDEVKRISNQKPHTTPVRFEPYLAGERTSMEQRTGAFTGLTLATTRHEMLTAIIDGLATVGAQRLELLRTVGRIGRDVMVSGGRGQVGPVMRRDWPGKWRVRQEQQATLRGLGLLVPKQ